MIGGTCMRYAALFLGAMLVMGLLLPLGLPSPSSGQPPLERGILFVSGGASFNQVRAYNLNTDPPTPLGPATMPPFAINSASIQGIEDIVCGPDGRVYAALTGLTGQTKKIVRFEQDGAQVETVLDFGALPNGHPLKTSGGPEGPSFEVLVQDDGRAVPSGRLTFNTRFGSAISPHKGVWVLQNGTPFQVLALLSPGGDQPWGEGTIYLTHGPFIGHLLAVERTNGRVERRGPIPPSLVGGPLDFSVAGTAFLTSPFLSQQPIGLALDSIGRIYVSHRLSGDITRWSPNTPNTPLPPSPPPPPGFYAHIPEAGAFFIDFDKDNNLYVAQDTTFLSEEPVGRVWKVAPNAPLAPTILDDDFPRATGVAVCARRIPLAIDIKPGSFPNAINPRSRGVIPVGIFTTPGFNAPTMVDQSELRFGPTGTEAPPVRPCAQQDFDLDGDMDLVCHFRTQEVFAGGAAGVTELRLRFRNQDFEGRGSVELN